MILATGVESKLKCSRSSTSLQLNRYQERLKELETAYRVAEKVYDSPAKGGWIMSPPAGDLNSSLDI